MRKFFIHIGIIMLTVFIIGNAISFASLWLLRQSQFYKPAFLANSNNNNTFDYIVLGASTGLTTIDTQEIDANINTRGINLSVDNTALSSHYLMLQHFLAEGKKTKVCVLAPSIPSYSVNRKRIIENDYRFLMYVNRDYVSDYYDNFYGFESHVLKMSKWFPVIGVSYYNAEVFYPSIISLFKPELHNRFDGYGNYTYPVLQRSNNEIRVFKEQTVAFSNPYLEKIKALCEQNNIMLLCYITPINGKQIITSQNGFNIINHSALLKNSKYFYDGIHVNSIGRKEVSRQFANDLKEFL